MQPADRQALRQLLAVLRPHMAFGLLTLALVTLVFAAWPLGQLFFGWALNDVAAGTAIVIDASGAVDSSRLVWWLWFFGIYTAIRVTILYLAQVSRLRFGAVILRDLRAKLYRQVLRLDQAYHRQHGAGELITRTTRDGDKVRDAIYGGVNELLETFIMLLASLCLLTWYSPVLAALPIALFAGVGGLLLRQAGRLTALNRAADANYDHLTQDLTEGVEGVRVIKAFSMEDERCRRFAGHVERFNNATLKAVLFAAVHFSIPQAIFAIAHGWVLVVGAWLVSTGDLQVGDLVAALMAMTTCIFRLDALGHAMRQLADARASMQRLAEVLVAEPALHDGARPMPDGPLGLHCRGLVVRSDDEHARPVLDGLDLAVPAGQVVALVGPTGSGKSTFCQLLPRLQDPQAGSICLVDAQGDEHDLRDLPLTALRQRVQVSFQDTFLFSASVAENLRVPAPAASDEELWAALDAAALGDFIRDQEAGLETRSGERGLTLSGGQQQRLCLARALLAKPTVLILDDATSALDALTERQVLDALQQRLGGVTVILVASRLATAELADRVLVLDDGRIVADDSPTALAAHNALYRDLMGITREDAA